MTLRKNIMILTIIVLFLFQTGCTNFDINKIKTNKSVIENYNDLIEIYNKVVIDFTKLANNIDSEISENKNLNELDIEKYKSLKNKIQNNMDKLISQSRYFKDDLEFTEGIDLIVLGINDYFEFVDKELQNNESIVNREKIEERYNDIYQNSIEIVENIDRIYDEFQ